MAATAKLKSASNCTVGARDAEAVRQASRFRIRGCHQYNIYVFVEEEAEAEAGAAETAIKSTASASLVGAPLCTDGANSTNEHVR